MTCGDCAAYSPYRLVLSPYIVRRLSSLFSAWKRITSLFNYLREDGAIVVLHSQSRWDTRPSGSIDPQELDERLL